MATIIDLCEDLGLFGLGVLMFLNTMIGAPPSEIICTAFGAAAVRKGYSLATLILVATIMNVAGTVVLFGWARKTGKRAVRVRLRIIQRGKRNWLASCVGFGRTAIERVDALFLWHGPAIVCVGRNVPLIRSVISIPAGLSGMSLFSFLFYTTLGVALWVTSWILVGFFVGKDPAALFSYVHAASVLIGLGLVVGLVWAFLNTRNKFRRLPG